MMTLFLRTWIVTIGLSAAEDPAFTRLRQSAEPLSTLGTFLDKYVGECHEAIGSECKNQAARFRSQSKGKSFVLTLSDEAVNMVSLGPYQNSKKGFDVRITPFFGAGGYALTQGSPRKTDSQGNPLLPLLVAHASLGEQWSPERFQRLFSNHQLRLEVVFQPQGVWNLSSKRGGKSLGVSARLQGIQLVESRSGELVAVWLGR
jgi:uncharacterized protein DUF6066